VTDVNSDAIRCYERNPGTGASGVYNVTAGSTLNYNAKASISHPGPMAVYIAKVPAGKTAANWDGKGQVWSKIYQDMPRLGGSMTWPSQGMSQIKVSEPPPGPVRMLTVRKRCPLHPRHHPPLPAERRVPAPGRAHCPAQRERRWRSPVLHFMCPDQRQRRQRHVEPQKPCLVPRRLPGHPPRHHDQHLLPRADQLHAAWPAG
jgi:hypothetical protein